MHTRSRWMAALLVVPGLLMASHSALAQTDFSGVWQPQFSEDVSERLPGPELVDYLGLPINAAARQFAESWDPSRITLPEEQCRVHVSPYIYRGPMALRIWTEKHPVTQDVVAIKHYISTYEQTRTIYMDGRPHPGPNAPHTWMGFSTGRWEGDMLVVETTHIKQGWVRRNGLPMSDQAKLTEYFVNYGDVMTQTMILIDPVYLAEPLVKNQDFVRNRQDPPAQTWLWVCEPVVEIANRPEGAVPAYMPGEHPFQTEFAQRHRLPMIAVLGGPETMYPEFQKVMATAPVPPPLPAPPAARPAPSGAAGRGAPPTPPQQPGGGR
jgi:hypothetical protein